MGQTLVKDIESGLRADITRGILAPAQPLRLEALKGRFDAGFSPIREALSRLLAEGLVELEPNRGFRVAALSREDLLDIAVARIAVETAAVRRAIELGDDDWEAGLVGAMHRYRKLSTKDLGDHDTLVAWEQAHDALHATMISACGSQRLLIMQARYQEQHLRYRRLIVVPQVSGDAHIAEHERLIELVLARDADAAAKSIERHMMITVDALASAGFWNGRESPAG
ncbi:FCD domain-containing protein [Sphingomonas sp.]|jgi:DNA-binding GntR family transcriptional regulator|uniref:FCD domain-containing protein n=1 Tax=Sphingomonas sp. TaxID=28214 RepID=UPI002EDA1935